MKPLGYWPSFVTRNSTIRIFFLSLNTHVQPTARCLGGKGTKDHVLFLTRALYSSLAIVFHFSCGKAS